MIKKKKVKLRKLKPYEQYIIDYPYAVPIMIVIVGIYYYFKIIY